MTKHMGPRRRLTQLGIGAAVVAVASVLIATAATGSDPEPTLMLRGDEVTVDDAFSIYSMRSIEHRQAFNAAERAVFNECMANKGFTEEPVPTGGSSEQPSEEELAYNSAAVGDGDAMQPQVVELPSGEQAEVYTRWTPEACFWQSMAALQGDPIFAEALRLEITVLSNEASTMAAEQGAVSEVARACGFDSNYRVLEALEGLEAPAVVDSERQAGPEASTSTCASAEQLRAAQQAVTRSNLEVASRSENVANIEAWAELAEREASNAMAILDR